MCHYLLLWNKHPTCPCSLEIQIFCNCNFCLLTEACWRVSTSTIGPSSLQLMTHCGFGVKPFTWKQFWHIVNQNLRKTSQHFESKYRKKTLLRCTWKYRLYNIVYFAQASMWSLEQESASLPRYDEVGFYDNPFSVLIWTSWHLKPPATRLFVHQLFRFTKQNPSQPWITVSLWWPVN